jgi:deoxycytidine triphosphate deaminase
MVLSDNELRGILPDLQIVVPPGFAPFSADEQIKPASLDLRLGDQFWEPRRQFQLDLRRSELLEIEPRRFYRRRVLGISETITLKPGGMLLARTLEHFIVPGAFTADITGRSSFARLGLAVTATGNFINPGWHGHMPLQLINNGRATLRLVPGMPICQVRFLKLTSPAAQPYGSTELGSLYIDDDGGPSYWWRDKRIATLQTILGNTNVSASVQSRIFQIVGKQEPEVLERLERTAASTRMADLDNADSFLDQFAEREERRRRIRQVVLRIAQGLFTVGVTLLVLSTRDDLAAWRYYLWGASVVTFVVSIIAFGRDVGDHLGQRELRRLRSGT